MPSFAPTSAPGEVEYDTDADDVSSGSHECDEVSIKPAKNGGFVATARYKPEETAKGPGRYKEPDTYAFSDANALTQFIQEQFGGSDVAADTAAPPMPAAPPVA